MVNVMRKRNSFKRKVLLTLAAGVSLSYAGTLPKQWRIISKLIKEWMDIPPKQLRRSIGSLYKSSLVSQKENRDGSVTIVLTKKGKAVALRYKLEEMKVATPKRWDGKWRMVMFDVPEKFKKARDVFRFHLKKLNWFQQSNFHNKNIP